MITDFKLYEVNNMSSIDVFIDNIENCDIEYVKKHIASGLDIDDESTIFTPLMIALDYSQEEIAKLLIDNNANLNTQDSEGWTPLMWANLRGYEELVILMIEKGADITIEEYEGRSIFDFMTKKNIQIIKDKFPEKYEKWIMNKNIKKYKI